MSSLPRFPSTVCLLVTLGALQLTPLSPAATADSPQPTLLEQAYALDSAQGAARNVTGAIALYTQAAAQGDPYAQLRLGYLAETGDGIPQDYAVARNHYEVAAKAGLKEAMLRLAICDLEGWGGPVDRAGFVHEIRASADAGDPAAQRILSTMYGIGFLVPKDEATALAWMQKAAALDDPQAQLALGRRAENVLRLMPEAGVARGWFQLSAEHDYWAAMRAMARTFLTGSPSDQNWDLARHWLELASNDGDPEAPYTLALAEVLSTQAPTHDLAKADAWLKLASARGNERATEILHLVHGGKTLPEAMRYVLSVPFTQRYVEEVASSTRELPNGDRQPQVYRLVKPVYPLSLRLTGTTGNVIVDFVVDTTGRVHRAHAIQATNPAFAERAVEAVRQWRFHPGLKHGHAVNTHMRVPVWFQLPQEETLGVDGLLDSARDRAQLMGPAVEADATQLTVAKARTPLTYPLMPDGSPVPEGTSVLLLLVLDPAGKPIRGHILFARPDAAGPAVLASAMRAAYQPTSPDGGESHVVVPFLRRPGSPAQMGKGK